MLAARIMKNLKHDNLFLGVQVIAKNLSSQLNYGSWLKRIQITRGASLLDIDSGRVSGVIYVTVRVENDP